MSDDQNLAVDSGTEDARPEWLPDNFKSPEDLAKSYKELERQFHAGQQERSQLQGQLEELSAQFDQFQQQPQQPAADPSEQLYALYENDPLGTMAMLAQQAAQQAVANVVPQVQAQQQPVMEAQNQLLAYTADQIVAQAVTDWSEYKEKVAEAITEDPDLLPESALSSPERTARALERVYKMVKHDELQNQNKSLAEQQADLQRQVKLQAQTLSGNAGRPLPTDDSKAYWERVQNAPVTSYGDLMQQK